MQKIPSCDCISCPTSQDIPCMLLKPKADRRVHNSMPLVPVKSQMNNVTFRNTFLRREVVNRSPYHQAGGITPCRLTATVYSLYSKLPSIALWLKFLLVFIYIYIYTVYIYNQKRLESFEMWCSRRMEKISWTDHVNNEEVLLRVNEQRNILHVIRKRKANLIGHILRRNKLLKER